MTDRKVVRACVCVAAIVWAGCTVNFPGKLVPASGPIDVPARINTVGAEAKGSSCQWWLSVNAPKVGGFQIPLPMKGNQSYLTMKDALGEQYDGLVNAVTDHRITPYGLGFPVGSDPDPRAWVHVFAVEVCQEIRGTPFVYTKRLGRAD